MTTRAENNMVVNSVGSLTLTESVSCVQGEDEVKSGANTAWRQDIFEPLPSVPIRKNCISSLQDSKLSSRPCLKAH